MSLSLSKDSTHVIDVRVRSLSDLAKEDQIEAKIAPKRAFGRFTKYLPHLLAGVLMLGTGAMLFNRTPGRRRMPKEMGPAKKLVQLPPFMMSDSLFFGSSLAPVAGESVEGEKIWKRLLEQREALKKQIDDAKHTSQDWDMSFRFNPTTLKVLISDTGDVPVYKKETAADSIRLLNESITRWKQWIGKYQRHLQRLLCETVSMILSHPQDHVIFTADDIRTIKGVFAHEDLTWEQFNDEVVTQFDPKWDQVHTAAGTERNWDRLSEMARGYCLETLQKIKNGDAHPTQKALMCIFLTSYKEMTLDETYQLRKFLLPFYQYTWAQQQYRGDAMNDKRLTPQERRIRKATALKMIEEFQNDTEYWTMHKQYPTRLSKLARALAEQETDLASFDRPSWSKDDGQRGGTIKYHAAMDGELRIQENHFTQG